MSDDTLGTQGDGTDDTGTVEAVDGELNDAGEAGGGDGEGGGDDDEDAMFGELAQDRASGTRFDAMKDEDGAGDKGGADAGAAADKGGADAGAAADKGGADAGAADDKGGAAADQGGSGGFDVSGFGADVASARESLVAELGDLEVEPASGNDPAVKFSDLAKDYPGILQAMVAVAQRLTAPMRAQFEAQQFNSGREQLLGDLEADVPGARAIADSPEYAQWFGEQPEGIQALGYSADRKAAGKLLKLYLAEHPQAVKPGERSAQDAAGAAKRRTRLAILAAGSGNRGAGGAREHSPIEVAGVSEFVEDDEAEGLFNDLAKQRAQAKK